MKSKFFLSLLMLLLAYSIGLKGSALAAQHRIEYSASKPTVGQPITFTFTVGKGFCEIERVIPDAVKVNDIESFLSLEYSIFLQNQIAK